MFFAIEIQLITLKSRPFTLQIRPNMSSKFTLEIRLFTIEMRFFTQEIRRNI